MSKKSNFEKQILEIPGDEGFYKSDTEEAYLSAGEELLQKGFTEEEAIELLESLWSATSDEYGN